MTEEAPMTGATAPLGSPAHQALLAHVVAHYPPGT
jgi:hypothetical protein